MRTILILLSIATSALSQGLYFGSSVPADYNPATDASVVEWLKADAIVGLTDGQSVVTWNKSTGNDATSGAGNRPVYHTAAQNGLPGVQFAASGPQFMTVQTFGTLTQPYAVWVVYKFTSQAATEVIYDGTNSSGRASAVFSITSGFISAYAGSTAATTSTGDATTWHVLYILFNGASSQWSIDNSAPATFNPGANSLIGLFLGQNQPATQNFDGWIGELVVQNAAPVSVPNSFAYFKARWGTP